MADDEYNRKMQSLQQYIPFLNNMIQQLKDPKKKNREQQLQKMESLHAMITDKKKKLKLETLTKCEDVILKLYNKVKSASHNSPKVSNTTKSIPQTPASPPPPITPSSPSPPRDIPITKPVVIPTEKITERDNYYSREETSYKPKIDIYSSAADSLMKQSKHEHKQQLQQQKRPKTIIDIRPDMSKPPISLEDLEALQNDIENSINKLDTEKMSLVQLKDLREKLQKELSTSNKTMTNQKKEQIVKKPPQPVPPPSSSTNKSEDKSDKIKKVVKESNSIFGSTLSSIDDKLLENNKQKEKDCKKEEHRRSSTNGSSSTRDKDKKHEHHRSSNSTHHRDDKKESSSHKSKDKIDDKRKELDKNSGSRSEKRSKDDDRHKTHRDKDSDKSKDKDREHKDKGKDRDKIRDKNKDRHRHKEDESRKKDDKSQNKTTINNNSNKTKTEESKSIEAKTPTDGQVYKRLADKYNPKPRKVSIESKPEEKDVPLPVPPPSIPFLEATTTITTTTVSISTSNKLNEHNRQLHTTNIPQILSPSSSSCSIESELSNNGNNNHTQKRIVEPIPQPLNSILANPNTTALIKNVVNQLKQQETQQLRPLLPSTYTNLPPPPPQFNHQTNYGLLSPPQQLLPLPQQQMLPQQQNRPFITSNYPPLQQQRGRSFTPFEPVSTESYFPDYYQQQFYDNRFPQQQQQQQQQQDSEWRRDDQITRFDDRYHHDQRFGHYTQQSSFQYRDTRNHIDINTQQQQQRIDYDHRSRSRDPRLNRTNRDYGSSSTISRPRARSQSRDDSNIITISRSITSGSDDKFTSPLDSLYSNGDVDYRNQTGKGYGVQNFKIPKIRKDETQETRKPDEDNIDDKDDSINEEKKEQKVVDEEKVIDSTSTTKIDNKDKDIDDDNCNKEKIKEKKTDERDENNEITSSTNENDTTKVPKETDIINQFLKKLLENEETRAAASSFIDNVSKKLDDENLKQVVDTVKSITTTPMKKDKEVAEDEEEEEVKEQTVDKDEEDEAEDEDSEDDEDEDDDEDNDNDEEYEVEEEEEEIKVKKKPKRRRTVSPTITKNKKKKTSGANNKTKKKIAIERNKVRKQLVTKQKNQKPIKQSKPKQRHKTELDFLHEDIQEMFIRDGVLTATGKRMCRILTEDAMKQQQQSQQQPETTRVTRRSVVNNNNDEDKKTTMLDSEKIKQMSNVRVVLPKIDVEISEEDNKRYSLRSTNLNKRNNSNNDISDSSDDEKLDDKITKTPKKRTKTNNQSDVVTKKKRTDENNDENDLDEISPEIPTETNDDDKLYEYLEPDKNYYIEKTSHFKFPCKLCKFEGKNITQHYRLLHPDNEVLSSRLNPIKAENAIKQSIDLNLDNINIELDNTTMSPYKNYMFKCRFCDLIMLTRLTNFYEHITTHTGEYRHVCDHCLYGASNRKRVRSHCLQQHKKDLKTIAPIVKQKIYGYICSECNFVQIQRKNVENHVNIYHLGDDNKIHRIHLSTRPYDDHTGSNITDIIETNNTTTAKKRNSDEINDDDDDDDDTSRDEDNDRGDDAIGDEDIDKITEPISKKAKIDQIDDKIKEKKMIDMTVFTCNSDIFEDGRINFKTMTELGSVTTTIQKQRQSSNFIDELSNRLQQEQPEVVIKEEPIDSDMEKKEDKIVELSNKKPINTTSTTTVNNIENMLQQNKDNRIISDVIEKLQVKLKDEPKNNDYDDCDYYNEADNDEIITEPPPPLTPLTDQKIDNNRTIISAGFLNIIIYDDADDDNNLEYACRVPSCCYQTKDRQLFLQHWKDDHLRINQTCKMTKCKICHCDIKATNLEPLLTVFFNHIEANHGDLLIKTGKSQEESGGIIEQEEETPFPFKISNVMSLADSKEIDETTPPVGLQLKQIVLNELKLIGQERVRLWKHPNVLKIFIQNPANLYKCFSYFCKFTTNNRNLFDQHIKINHQLLDEYVVCVYCEDIKIPLIHSGLHIDLRHANCLFSCSKCLYRGYKKEYVSIHMKCKDHESNVVFGLPQIRNSIQKKLELLKIDDCQLYNCGELNCKQQFFYQNEFEEHLQQHEIITYNCGYYNETCTFKTNKFQTLIEHWYNHNCYRYYCQLCKSGFLQAYHVLKHYALVHPNCDLYVIDRSIKDNPTLKETIFNSSPLESPPSPNDDNTPIINDNTIDKPETIETNDDKTSEIMDSSSDSDNRLVIDEDKIDDKTPKDDNKDNPPIDNNSNIDNNVQQQQQNDQQVALNESLEVKSLDLLGSDLYRCAICLESFNNSKLLKSHLIKRGKLCLDLDNNRQRPYKCIHCNRSFRNTNGLLEHIHYHGKLRFACSLCVRKFPLSFCLKLHMRNKHNVTQTIIQPVTPNKTDLKKDNFILKPKPTSNDVVNDNFEQLQQQQLQQLEIQQQDDQFDDNIKEYSPNDIDLLPKRHIFLTNIKCKLCSYSTKVRTNLVRHFHFHNETNIDNVDVVQNNGIVPNMAPINPVPCLEKNEKMFDKMTNLAISSFAGNNSRMGGGSNGNNTVTKSEKGIAKESDLPDFVPINRRYVCCINDCNYLCPQESNLRHHLLALHKQEGQFICQHCKLELRSDIDQYIKHLKLHDINLYKCYYCKFISNFKHKIEKHSTDQHLDKLAKIQIIRQLGNEQLLDDNNSDETVSSTTKVTKPWHCGMCKYRSVTKQEVTNHISNRHDIDKQYKCTLCTYKNDDKTTFEQHFKNQHPDNDIDIICMYYNHLTTTTTTTISNKNFDTTPLWQRDRPRIRHIRGILFEEQTPVAKSVKKSNKLPQQPPYLQQSNLDLAIEAVAKGEDTTTQDNNESIIIIDDDDNNNNNNNNNNSSDDIDDSGDDGDLLKITKIEPHNDDSNDLLTKDSIINRYGSLISANGKYYRCPLCKKFKIRKIDTMVYHILQELNYKRYSCKLCDYSCLTQMEISMHLKLKHNIANDNDDIDCDDDDDNDNIIKLNLPETLIIWLELFIRYQTESVYATLKSMDKIHDGCDGATAILKIYCATCHKWFKHVRAMKDHELIHWLEQTYTCGLCDKDLSTIDLYLTHHIKEHQNQQFQLKMKDFTIKSIIENLSTSSQSTTIDDQPEPTASIKSSPITTQTATTTTTTPTTVKNQTYVCYYCMETTTTMEALHEHWKLQHESNNVEFYYKIQQQQQQQYDKNSLYCCSICHDKDTEENLRKHFIAYHPNKKYQTYQFICLECNRTFSTTKQVRAHFNNEHPKKRIQYCEIEKKLSNTNMYVFCMKCPFRSCTNSGMRQHLRKHLRPLDCKWCGETFIAQVDVRNHQQKEHPDQPEHFEENRVRMNELDRLCKQAQMKNARESLPIPIISTVTATRAVAKKSTGAPAVRKDPATM